MRRGALRRATDQQGAGRGATSGYAYLALLYVIALMAIAATGVAALDHLTRRQLDERELLRQGHEFRAALLSYRQAHPSRQLPMTLDQLLEDSRGPVLQRHLRRIHVDPMTRQAEWGLVLQANQIVGVHSLSERMPLKQAGFDEEDATFSQAKTYQEWVFMALEPLQPDEPVRDQSAAQLGL